MITLSILAIWWAAVAFGYIVSKSEKPLFVGFLLSGGLINVFLGVSYFSKW
jgi:uncharacterized integral membrane protein